MKAILFPKEVWKMTRPFIVSSRAFTVVYSNLFRGSPELEEKRKERAMHRRTCATGIVLVWMRMLAKGTLTIQGSLVDASMERIASITRMASHKVLKTGVFAFAMKRNSIFYLL